MSEPSERDREMAREMLAGLGFGPDGMVQRETIVAAYIAAAREEGRREPRPILRRERVPFVVETDDRDAARAALEAAEEARG